MRPFEIGCSFLDPHLTTYHSTIGVHIIVVLELDMSTLRWTWMVHIQLDDSYGILDNQANL